MLSNKFGVIAGVAMLGTAALLGTNAANAEINLSVEAAMKVNPAVTYAKETLKAKVDDDSMYYVIDGGDDALDVTANLGLAAGGDATNDLIIMVELEGMVFTADSLDGASLTVEGESAVSESAGGDKGDTSATFAAKRGAASNGNTTTVTLAIDELGITSDGPGGITMMITNVQQRQLLTGIVDNPGANTASYSGAIAVKDGLKETPDPNNPVALVSDGFKSFGVKNADASETRDLRETVGSFAIALSATDLLDAADGMTIAGVAELVDVGTEGADVADGGSSVTFTGDFSFAAMVWLDEMEECDDGSPTDLLKRDPDDATMVTDTNALKPQPPATVMANPNLCISVPVSTEEMPVSIPSTGKYAAVTTYKSAVAEAPFKASGGTHELGMIERDGTTVRLPFLTTAPQFKQLIIITNRGGATDYYFEFTPEDGVDATGTMMADDELESGTTIMKTTDVVNITVGDRTTGRTAGTLVVEAQRGMIDVATNQINTDTGNSDLVTY